MPIDLGNLESQIEYFKIPKGKAHDAKEDVKMTVEVYKAYRQLLSAKKSDVSGLNTSNLLDIIES